MPKRIVGGLSERRIRATRQPGMIADGRGLYLRTTISGAKGWIFRYQIAGQRHDMGLGSIDDISLAEARDEIHELHRLIRQGVDPIDARRSKRAMSEKAAGRTVTFQKFADEFVSLRQVEWRNAKHAEQWTKTLSDYVYPVCGSWPIDTIDTPTVLRVLTPLWTKIPETASRLRGRIEAILDGAKTAGHRQGENPARWKGHLANLLPRKAKVRRVEHHAALPYTEIGSFMVELRQKVGTAARALEFTILTIGRTGEVLKARWNEIDLDEGLWTIPADRMKAGREHRVPLSARAAEILEEMREIRVNGYVFPGARNSSPLSDVAMLRALQRMGRGDLTVHGFRSTFSDWCRETTRFAPEIRKMALAHTLGDKVEGAYSRGDLFRKRRQVMDAWANYIDRSSANGTVVPLAQKAVSSA